MEREVGGKEDSLDGRFGNSVTLDRKDGGRGSSHGSLRHTSDHRVLATLMSMSRHDDEIRVVVLRRLGNGFRRLKRLADEFPNAGRAQSREFQAYFFHRLVSISSKVFPDCFGDIRGVSRMEERTSCYAREMDRRTITCGKGYGATLRDIGYFREIGGNDDVLDRIQHDFPQLAQRPPDESSEAPIIPLHLGGDADVAPIWGTRTSAGRDCDPTAPPPRLHYGYTAITRA